MSMKSFGKFIKGGGGAAINILEVHRVGRTRYILSTDSVGRIRVFREDGSSLYGSFMPSSRALAFLKQRLMFLTETGAGSLDLRSMKLKESECEGLNQSVVRTYVFDATERSKAYGYTSVASDHEMLIVLVLGCGFIGIYQTNLPIYKSKSSNMLWTSPMLFFILFLLVAWQFSTKKKEALTSWGPNNPFTSASAISNPPLGGNTEDRSLVNSSSRDNDSIDQRVTGLRPPARRYVSPTRYPTGVTTTTTTFRTGIANHNSRLSVDPNFRTSSELKYRGAPLEPPGFPKRREGIYANNQKADDSNR